MKANNNKIDVIGDVHGRCAELKALLAQLGYAPKNGAWRNPERTALFIGDLVDRGPDVPGVLELVKEMADAGSARVLLGNHEFNLLCWYTPDGKGDYLRTRKDKRNEDQIASTRPYFETNPEARELYLNWFRSLPITLQLGGARFVHAYWGPAELTLLSGRNTMDECGWGDPAWRTMPVGVAFERLIKGPEIRLPKGYYTLDRENAKRTKVRVIWWKNGRNRSMRDMILPYTPSLPEDPLPEDALAAYEPYEATEPVLFFGHYGFKGFPGLMAPNVACVDYTEPDRTTIGAYRWDGEQTLREDKFIKGGEVQ